MAPFHLPEWRLVVERELVAAPRVVDEHVEPALLAPDPIEQGLDLGVVCVVAANWDPDAAASAQFLGGFVDRPGPAERRRLAPHVAASDVDGRTLLAEDERDALA